MALVELPLFTIYENRILLCIGIDDDMVFDLSIIGLLDRPGDGRCHFAHIGTWITQNLGQDTSTLELDTEPILIVCVFT